MNFLKAIKENNVALIESLVNSRNYSAGAAVKGGGRRGKKSTPFDPNARSIYGRTALHLAATWDRREIVRILVNCSAVNVNLADRENGWTALHRALYLGNICVALILLSRKDLDLNIKDYDGNTPFDLFNSTINGTNPTPRHLFAPTSDSIDSYLDPMEFDPPGAPTIGGTELYTWGVNTNYVLAHPDSDNRKRVALSYASHRNTGGQFATRPDAFIVHVTMAKLHTAMVTSEETDNLLVCGFGNGGRLGGSAETQLTLRSVAGVKGQARTVTLGRDHTVVVMMKGDVLTFGSNKFGQLGYLIECNEDEEPVQLTPRKVITGLKREFVVGAAASRVHTAVHTRTEVFTFGLNAGQLGYHKSAAESIQYVPRKVTTLPQGQQIVQVAVTDNATACLLQSHDVIVFSDFGHQKIAFPMQRFPHDIRSYTIGTNYIVKIIAGGDSYLGAISNMGELFVWSTSSGNSQQSIQSSVTIPNLGTVPSAPRSRPSLATPRRVWTLRKSHFALRDAAIGQDGSVIVCTKSGHVFVGTPRRVLKRDKSLVEPKYYKFERIQFIQRAVMVTANPSGAFAVVKADYELKTIVVRKETLGDDLKRALPQYADEGEAIMVKSLAEEEGSEGDEEAEEAEEHDAQPKSLSHAPLASDRNVLDNWNHIVADAEDDELLDVVFVVEGKAVYAHRIVLAARSSFFDRLFRDNEQASLESSRDERIVQGLTVRAIESPGGQPRTQIVIPDHHLQPFLLLLDYLYTDKYTHPWDPSCSFTLATVPGAKHPTISDSPRILPPRALQSELESLARLFRLPALLASASSSYIHPPAPTLELHFAAVATDLAAHAHLADVTLQLADRRVRCHEVILVQRCPFFGAMLGTKSAWVKHRREAAGRGREEGVVVDLRHLEWEIIRIILKHVYADVGVDVFEDVEKETADEFVYFVIEVMAAANELLLARLKEACEAVLRRFVVLRNVSMVLDMADMYEAEQLKAACLDFICVNMETMLESGLFEGLDDRLVEDIEHELQLKQAEKMPMIRALQPTELATPADGVEDNEFLDVPNDAPDWQNDIYETIRPKSFTSLAPLLGGTQLAPRSSTESAPDDYNGDDVRVDFNPTDDPSSSHDMIFHMDEHPVMLPAKPNSWFAGASSPTRPKKSEQIDAESMMSSPPPRHRDHKGKAPQQPMFGSAITPGSSSPTETSPRGFKAVMAAEEEVQRRTSGESPAEAAPKSGWTATGGTAVAVESKPSLREILEQEVRVNTQRPVTPAPASLGKLVTGWPIQSLPDQLVAVVVKPKLSQKERRKLEAASKALETVTPPQTAPLTPSPARTNPWGQLAVVSSSGNAGGNGAGIMPKPGEAVRKTSLIEIEETRGEEDKVVSREFSGSKSPSDSNPWAATSPSSTPPRASAHTGNLALTPPTLALRMTPRTPPRKTSSVQSPTTAMATSPVASSSFAFIQKQQQHEQNVLRGRVLKKSLVRIQKEERAVEALREFYVQTAEVGGGEWFTVDKVE